MEALKAGGCGGTWEHVSVGEGLLNSDDPWDNPPGDFIVKVRFPPVKTLHPCIPFAPLMAIASREDKIGGAVAACLLGDFLKWKQLVAELQSDDDTPSAHSPSVVCLHNGKSSTGNAIIERLSTMFSPARVFSLQITQGNDSMLLDDEYLHLSEANVIILDMQTSGVRDSTVCSSWSSQQLRHDLAVSGLWDVLVERRLSGAYLVAIDDSCSLLGQSITDAASVSFLPYIICSSSALNGWKGLYTAIRDAAEHRQEELEGVGFLQESVTVIDGITHEAEQVVSSTREVIAATALQNMAAGFCPNYRFHEYFDDKEDKGYSERCTAACLDACQD